MSQSHTIVSASGVKMPALIYGTAWKKERTAALVTQAVLAGFRGIDTACQPKHYHEPGVGAGLQACYAQGITRAELYLQSKFTPLSGQDPLQVPYAVNASISEQVQQSVQQSLHNLQTAYLDGLLLHSPFVNPQHTYEAWRAMEQAVQQGFVKQLGISNCYQLSALRELYQQAEIKPVIIQNRFYADTHYDQEIRTFCQQQQLIYQSFWSLTANPHILTSTLIRNLAQTYHCTPAQVFFRYLSQRGIIPLTGTCSQQHMQEDLAIFAFSLRTPESAAIDALLYH